MFGKRKDNAPYGWRSYRENLLLLYDDVGGRGTDRAIDDLINKTKYEDVEERPDFGEQWADLNELESRLFRILDSTRLDAEMERKFVQAEYSGLTSLAPLEKRYREFTGYETTLTALQKSFDEIIGGDVAFLAERRARAIAYIEEMFVKYSYRHSAREKREEVSKTLTFFGIVILGIPLFLGLAYALIELFEKVIPTQALKGFLAIIQEWLAGLATGTSLPFFILFVVMYSGIVGAYFSRVTGYVSKMEKLRWNEMDVLYSPLALATRLLVGAAAAAVILFLIMGQLTLDAVVLQESFPPWVLKPDKPDPLIPLRPSEEFSRLIIWSVIAGFFERFVPDRLGKVRDDGQGSEADSSHRSG